MSWSCCFMSKLDPPLFAARKILENRAGTQAGRFQDRVAVARARNEASSGLLK